MRNLKLSYQDVRNLPIWKRRVFLKLIEQEYKELEKKYKSIEQEMKYNNLKS